MAEKKLVLIDGHALAYRMFHALKVEHFSTRLGEPTNATFGFTRTLIDLITAKQPPDYLAVAFDVGGTFRDALFAGYKGTRDKMPDELAYQIGRIHQVLEAFNIPVIEMDGYEADDLLGTIARRAPEWGVHTLIITGDRDLLQLVNDHTSVQLPGKSRGEAEVYNADAVYARFGFGPAQIVDYKAIAGDPSDNIPGVPGIGNKGATTLLQQYGTLDDIYANLEGITAKRQKAALDAGRESAYLSYQLARIVTDAPVVFDLESCRTHDYNREDVVRIFQELEFRSLIGQLPGAPEAAPEAGQQLSFFDAPAPASDIPGVPASQPSTLTHIVRTQEDLETLAQALEAAPRIAFDTETTSTDQMQAELVGISLAVSAGEGYYIPVGHTDSGEQLPLGQVIARLRPALSNPAIPKAGHNIKYDAIVMARHGLEVSPLSFDTMVAAWLVQPAGSQGKLGLKAQAFMRCGVEMTEISELLGRGKKQITMDQVPVEQAAPYAAADADMTLRLVEKLTPDLASGGVERLFNEVEMPLVPVLIAMERAGVLVDTAFLQSMSGEISATLESLTQRIYEIAGQPFNLNSTQQLSDILFGKLQLPAAGLRKTQSGFYSTAADVLDGLLEVDTTGIIEAILEYREFEKLRSTYLDALPRLINPETGRIHTSFNQTGASSGRLSSSDPNLQNIPIRTEQGRRVRFAFVAAPGHRLVGADYSQVELRVLAHICKDEGLQRAFHDNQDIHASTAAAVYGIPLNAVTSEQRSFAKRVNFGLIYGMGAFRLARDSNMTRTEAEEFIKTYFGRFPRIQAYLDATKRQMVEAGYVETLLGRRRYFPQLDSASRQTERERRDAERAAINMPIQGTAADIMKIAMNNLYRALIARGLQARILLQVHDELLLEAPDAEVDE
ncbi:MAG: DNA polymerase I, partial [Anaerolineae bacterium]|nr:DNA polymerase I [Anaerolineae bacterium]